MDSQDMAECSTDEQVRVYLQYLLDACRRLARSEEEILVAVSLADAPAHLAKLLLEACKLDLLLESTGDLPDLTFRPKIDWGYDSVAYRRRRIDYLRQVLRAMAPLSFHVAAHVCSLALDSRGDDDGIKLSQRQAVWVLFSQWLPLADHLWPMVHDLFSHEIFDSPLQPSESLEEKVPLLQAAQLYMIYLEERGEGHVYRTWFDWSHVFGCLQEAAENANDDAMEIDDDVNFEMRYESTEYIVKWYAARVAGLWLDMSRIEFREYLERHDVSQDVVPFEMHVWTRNREETKFQENQLRRCVSVWKEDPIHFPVLDEFDSELTTHQLLVRVAPGLYFYRYGGLENRYNESCGNSVESRTSLSSLVRTETTTKNLSFIGHGLAMLQPYPPPILVCGPPGSGKSCLIREVARLLHSPGSSLGETLLEIHVDEESDAKTLIGSYTTTDIPGQFEWRPGALTTAVRRGQWVLLEEVNTIPIEVQASLVSLLEDRRLPLGNGKSEPCHTNFRLFGTLTVNADQRNNDRGVFEPSLWQKVQVDPLPAQELVAVATALFPKVPTCVVDTALKIFCTLDRNSGRQSSGQGISQGPLWGAKNPSVRDLFKIISRVESTVTFEAGTVYITERQRSLCLAETYDIFVASCPDPDVRRQFLESIAAPAWGLSFDIAAQHIEGRTPSIITSANQIHIGRAKIDIQSGDSCPQHSGNFAATGFSLRLMEAVGVCAAQNEPTLLVGETGCGKTTLLQQVARMTGRQLVVQNLSLQTDSTDLLGGFRPLQIKELAGRVHGEFIDIFTSTFSRKQNEDFLSFASKAVRQELWEKASQCFRRAAKLGVTKVGGRKSETDKKIDTITMKKWQRFQETAERFEQQRRALDAGLAFAFSEGALINAITSGKWVLLDEINLASSETLQRLVGLLDDQSSSITLTERGDTVPLLRHPDFRLFAAMNPATDSGKKDLNASIRSRFTELYVDELLHPLELRLIASGCISQLLPATNKPVEHSDIVIQVVELYLQCRELAQSCLHDGAGQKPRYTLRTLTRGLFAAHSFVLEQKFSIERALFEGFSLAFGGPLSQASSRALNQLLVEAFVAGVGREELNKPGRRPGGRSGGHNYVMVEPFWIDNGEIEPMDWSQKVVNGCTEYVLVESTKGNLRRLARAVAAGPWPILLEGPTSAGKTSLVEYLAARCGHRVVRINNHEHTDVQEYVGGFAADSQGGLSFQEGLLVEALRGGFWVILDELNLAPSEVLEALNRLLDDNRELYIAETNETVQPHPRFRLFATQNPSGAYGGRKPLSRAFRNRFVEIQLDDIPSKEMVTILKHRCACPPSHAKALVAVMDGLRQQRNQSGLFLGKDGFITPRDLLRWAGRGASSKTELAQEGCFLLAERLRSEKEKTSVCREIEKHLKVKLDFNDLMYGEQSEARLLLAQVQIEQPANSLLAGIAPTRSLLRLLTLVLRCKRRREPILLVGETGCGKTTVVQLLSAALNSNLHIVNCHATTETADLLGSLRPARGRSRCVAKVKSLFKLLVSEFPDHADIPAMSRLEKSSDSETVSMIVEATRKIWSSQPEKSTGTERLTKRQKLHEGAAASPTAFASHESMAEVVESIEEVARDYQSLFEWSDGPLVQAMNAGEMILLDEMSLAEDAVLERLNSVLEPSRTLVLAEKPVFDKRETRTVVAHHDFQLFGTMNPGGDFGKRELSPALRSRFTEIWVPVVTERSDIDNVLDRSMSRLPERVRNPMKERMIDYFEWFNGPVCSDPASPSAELALSLRDILTWSAFTVVALEKNRSLCPWSVYYHGACLMHLDGLGLGTAVSRDDIAAIKVRAGRWLETSIPADDARLPFQPPLVFGVESSMFGSAHFRIPLGESVPELVSFNFGAPTTAQNMFRVLRAMQLPKPILLEGAPGVGKTTLLEALAKASGHKLTRINLSEQTDISDLFGSDLPVPDSNCTGLEATRFSWCDGVLLSALKNGNWVLLDELNLASQAVLEGLNSCLDHRASVYVPELGQSYACPTSFRVFAAQNPVGQGGGRKGLPKSFLNRFTKVYVDALTQKDMNCIVKAKFPNIPNEAVDRLLLYNSRLCNDVVTDKKFGHAGAPWEFNLRDVFRWCELYQAYELRPLHLTRDLYFQRFRTVVDRSAALALYRECADKEVGCDASACLQIDRSEIVSGGVAVERQKEQSAAFSNVVSLHPLTSQLTQLAAISKCVAQGWPCLLLAQSCQCTIINTCADLVGAKILEVCLSPSSDVSELIGCFEQSGVDDAYSEQVYNLISFAKECLASSACEASSSLLHYVQTKPSLKNTRNAIRLLHSLPELLGTEHIRNRLLGYFKSAKDTSSNSRGQFVWKDGILVKAMQNGYWLHLKNANLCPASVLDRLNPVMEPNGYLLMAECGKTGHNQAEHRIVECHPNFRVFLSMDQANGEVSRAMRNRCVEISILNENPDRVNSADQLHVLKRNKIQSLYLSATIGTLSGDRQDRNQRIATAMACSLQRGLFLQTVPVLREFFQRIPGDRLQADGLHSPSSSLLGRHCWCEKTEVISRAADALDIFSDFRSEASKLVQPFEYLRTDKFSGRHFETLCSHLVVMIYKEAKVSNTDKILRYFRGIESDIRGFLEFAAATIKSVPFKLYSEPGKLGALGKSWFARLHMQLLYRKWHCFAGGSTFLRNDRKSILEVSHIAYYSLADSSAIKCKVTRSIVPFLVALDEWVEALYTSSQWDENSCPVLEQMFAEQFGFWLLVRRLQYASSSCFLPFDETQFMVQWDWLEKICHRIPGVIDQSESRALEARYQSLTTLQNTISRELSGGRPLSKLLSSFSQNVSRPAVPTLEQNWNVLFSLTDLSDLAIPWETFASELHQVYKTLASMVEQPSFYMFVDASGRRQLLHALGSFYGCCTNEIGQPSPGIGQDTGEQALRATALLFSKLRKEWADRLRLVCGGNEAAISTSLSVEELKTSNDVAVEFTRRHIETSDLLLRRFAVLQLSPCHETWCIVEERRILRDLCSLICRKEFGQSTENILVAVKSLIDVVIEQTTWSVRTCRPLQTLAWALDLEQEADASILNKVTRLLPALFHNMYMRSWSSCQFRLKHLSMRLEMPSILSSDTRQDNEARMLHNVDPNVLAQTVGVFVAGYFGIRKQTVPLCTIENHAARSRQVESLVNAICSLSHQSLGDFPFDLQFVLLETMEALRDFFGEGILEDFVAILRHRSALCRLTAREVDVFVAQCSDQHLVGILQVLLFPLIQALLKSAVAIVEVYLGLLRFHLLLPPCPIDPAKKPAAEVSLLSERVELLDVESRSIELNSSVNFCQVENSSRSKEIERQKADLESDISRSRQLIVERHSGTPAFSNFFRETHEMASRHCSISHVKNLVDKLLLAEGDISGPSEADNWCLVVESFCVTMLDKYRTLEEISLPIVTAITMIKHGITDLGLSKPASIRPRVFPYLEVPEVDALANLQKVTKDRKNLASQKTESLHVAALATICSSQRIFGQRREISEAWLQISAWIPEVMQGHQDDSKSLPPDAQEEQEFREQFPDYLTDMLLSEEDCMESDEPEPRLSATPSDSSIDAISLLHRDMFLSDDTIFGPECLQYFKVVYNGRAILQSPNAGTTEIDSSGHIVALALATPMSGNTFEVSPLDLDKTAIPNFHTEPDPTEVTKASEPVRRLKGRLQHLQTLFPGNEVLDSIIRVVEQVARFDVSTVSFGRALSGLEAILRQAQDWEEHASDRVRLGASLQAVSELVGSWRRTELKSWSSLLLVREKRFRVRARRHWARLQCVLSGDHTGKKQLFGYAALSTAAPSWLLRTINGPKSGFVVLESLPDDFDDVFRILDTFILTAPLGEIEERLLVLKAFAVQLRRESYVREVTACRLTLARGVFNLWLHYNEYATFFRSQIDQRRRPFEQKLKDEAKLAKWDEQSYYAQAESSEKNHRKLMRILREYDEALEINTGTLIEEESSKGLRGDADKVISTSIPPYSAIFPLSVRDAKLQIARQIGPTTASTVSWTAANVLRKFDDPLISSIGRYGKKMDGFYRARLAESSSISITGYRETHDLCESIFQRIENLRSPSSTRPMKERAVNDLFRELKHQGYATTQADTPKEVSSMKNMLEVSPLPVEWPHLSESDISNLEGLNTYYTKCVFEANKFRGECTAGSAHLTQRQTFMMKRTVDEALLLLAQQRVILSSVLFHKERLSDLVETLTGSLGGVSTIRVGWSERLPCFLDDVKAAFATLARSQRVVQARSHLSQSRETKQWCLDVAAQLSTFISRLSSYKSSPLFQSLFLSAVTAHTVNEINGFLVDGLRTVLAWKSQNDAMHTLPNDVFEACRACLEKVIKSSADCVEWTADISNCSAPNPKKFLSSAISRVLVAVQEIVSDAESEEEDETIWTAHRHLIKSWLGVNSEVLREKLVQVFESVADSFDEDRVARLSVADDVVKLYGKALSIIDIELGHLIRFYRETAKLQYVLVRVFRTLAAKGYCSDKTEEQDGDGDAQGMTFEDDVDGTGMGEGEGKRDVTEELENEEQLLGLKDQPPLDDENTKEQGSNQLDREEAETGMEMEANFEGDMFDMPNDEKDEQDSNEDEEAEELDREIGNDQGVNDEVVDEKLWDGSDDENEQNADDDGKLEDDSGIQGAPLSGEMTTQQDDEGDTPKGNDPDNCMDDDIDAETEPYDDAVNEDEKYEENHGVPVRDDRPEEETNKELELDDDLEMDIDEEGAGRDSDVADNTDNSDQESEENLEDSNDGPIGEDEGDDNASIDETPDEATAKVDDAEADITEAPKADEIQDTPMTAEENSTNHEGLGVRFKDGNDAVQGATEEEEDDIAGEGDNVEQDHPATEPSSGESSSKGGTASGSGDGDIAEGGNSTDAQQANNLPNPFKSQGDVTKYWHRKLQIVQSDVDAEVDENCRNDNESATDQDHKNNGNFEYVGEDENGVTQTLGEVDQADAQKLEEQNADTNGNDETPGRNEDAQPRQEGSDSKSRRPRLEPEPVKETVDEETTEKFSEIAQSAPDEKTTSNAAQGVEDPDKHDDEPQVSSTTIVSDLKRLLVQDSSKDTPICQDEIVEEDHLMEIGDDIVAESRLHWSIISSETYSLSRRLCEKLRLVMEPLLASKLRGDYRTGKRINMKRVIGYIASGYRRDKIWLRRTKPAKRDYRVLVAVDDSESMQGGTGEIALRAMATLAVGMSQLEIGEIGVASFGNEMSLLHRFDEPFTAESGANIVRSFGFNQRRTRTALCVQSAMKALDDQRHGQSSMQLVFLISDGRIERDSRATLRRLIRDMMERNILLAMVIVEGKSNEETDKSKLKKDSILNMREVSFENGKPLVKKFMDDYPFPYYIVLDDMQTLPEVLGDALRQWYEMLTRLEESGF